MKRLYPCMHFFSQELVLRIFPSSISGFSSEKSDVIVKVFDVLLPECFFQLCGEHVITVFCPPPSLWCPVWLYLLYYRLLKLIVKTTMFYCKVSLSFFISPTKLMYFHIKSLRAQHWLAPVDVLYAEVKTCMIWYQSLITFPLGISEAWETISKFQLETCLFHIVWCSLLSWSCWKRMYFKRKYCTTLCFLRGRRGWTMYLFEFLNLSRLLRISFP